MKKNVKVFALAVMMVICGQAMAQSRGNMFVGASIPMKDYAEFDGFNEFALTTFDTDENNAGAGIGFNAGIRWYFNVGVKGLDVMLSIDGIYNGPNSDLKTAYRKNEGTTLGTDFKYNSTPKIINLPAMLGLNYIYRINPNLGIFIEAGAGGNLRFITEMESITKTAALNVQVRETQHYDNTFSFAYQAGIGFEVAKNLVIGCSFYDLGSAEVKGDHTLKTTILNDNTTNSTSDYRTMGSVHPIMILGRIGFSF